ncbi:NF038132 family protein [Sabulicella glaciei]|uniref:NF038132 family protein n=1 Tax=Sabulicella glaciei TaxID=2984948 RepID=A0ABT3P0K6_9PROT|nr:NF038132 family protein [Roseococcus sp. MDT2-1-1]MCW8087949.1 NF038132 family protein [Roseococcus sp. MDT2-1-1]
MREYLTWRRWLRSGVAFSALAGATFLALPQAAEAAPIPAGYSCVGACGTLGADGVVTAPPVGGSTYQYVSTWGGTNGVGSLPGVGGTGSPTDGSTLSTPVFAAQAGDALNFAFNYVTSDGSGYADYAWARLVTDANVEVALLFTARTTPGGDTVPGFGMPTPAATLSPASTPINPGATIWSPLGADSGRCFNGPTAGCGNTGWILSNYTIAAAGNYKLQFGVTNWNDTQFASGMAIAGVTVGGKPIDPVPVPEPASLALLGFGLAGVAAMRRRRKVG